MARGDEEWKAKQSESQKKRWQNPEYRKKMSQYSRKGKKLEDIVGEEKAVIWKENISNSCKNKKHNVTEEGKTVLRQNIKSEAVKNGLIKFNKSDKRRNSASKRMKKTWEENYDVMRQHIVDRVTSDDGRERLSEISSKLIASGFDPNKSKYKRDVNGIYYASKLEKNEIRIFI